MMPRAAPLRRCALRSVSLIGLSMMNQESRRADSNRLTLLQLRVITHALHGSHGVAMLHRYANSFSLPCPALCPIAFPMVSK
jgi:hypothetical protein